ncbi:MAG TPA: DUF4389 domain-containing protein [Gammaproteobacteria bacterium]|nr:DUF4389 domain-containing protein [Gammaproteobacteria bacterium]
MSSESSRKIEDNVQSKTTWLRFFYMIVLGACFAIAETVGAAMVLFQFFHVLFTGERNANLIRFGSSLSLYLYQVARYMTYNTEERPFPFQAWPAPEAPTVTEEPEPEPPAA